MSNFTTRSAAHSAVPPEKSMQPEQQLQVIDLFLAERIPFPDPQPGTCKYSLGTKAAGIRFVAGNSVAHGFLIPKSYIHPDYEECVVIELCLQRLDYWYLKTHPDTRRNGRPRDLSRYVAEAERLGIVYSIEGPHQFRMLKDSPPHNAFLELKRTGLLPLQRTKGEPWKAERRPTKPHPRRMYYACPQCEETDFTENTTLQANMRSGKRKILCVPCDRVMVIEEPSELWS